MINLIMTLVSLANAESFRCGTDWAAAEATCGQGCPNALDRECPTNQYCYRVSDCWAQAASISYDAVDGHRCGYNWASAACGSSCPSGLDRDCGGGMRCYANVGTCPGSSFAASVSKNVNNDAPVPKPHDSPSSFSHLIGKDELTRAMRACGVTTDIYSAFSQGFSAKISSLKELALLLGNTAHESARFTILHEINCSYGGCSYGRWYGRGYIQLTGEANYKQASIAVGNPEIYSNPDVVAEDPVVSWQTVSWYWSSTVQPTLNSQGETLAASVLAINGALECGSRPINPDRISTVQCFTQQLVGYQDSQTWC